jgi:hypothetical protein
MKKKPAKRRFSKTKGKGLSPAELKKISGGVEYSLRVLNRTEGKFDPEVYKQKP